jgi:hypothetical protein
MSLTPREVRQMVRESRRLVQDVCDAHKGPTDVRDEYIKTLEARCELQEKALDESVKLVNLYKRKACEQEEWIEEQNKIQKIQENILLRARHLEVHVEHRSLRHPPLPDATLPRLTETEWRYFSDMKWCLKDFDARREVSELENYYYELAALEGDYRIPSIDAFLHDKVIPSTRANPVDFHYTDRWLLSCPKYYPPSDETDDEFWIESASSARE